MNPASAYLAGKFVKLSKATNLFTRLFNVIEFTNTKSVSIDVMKATPFAAIPRPSPSAGPQLNEVGDFVGKEITPPTYFEATIIDADKVLSRQPGEARDSISRGMLDSLTSQIFTKSQILSEKIFRAYQVQAAQALITGRVALPGYSTNFGRDSGLTAAATPSWVTATFAQKVISITNHMDLISAASSLLPNRFVFGSSVFNSLMSHVEFQNQFVQSRAVGVLNADTMDMSLPTSGFLGYWTVNGRQIELWSDSGTYSESAGFNLNYIDPGAILMMNKDTRLDAYFCGFPNIRDILGIDAPLRSLMPPRISSAEQRVDIHNILYIKDNDLMLGVGSRPIFVPVDVDSTGVLNTGL